jgi:hypothetical protein
MYFVHLSPFLLSFMFLSRAFFCRSCCYSSTPFTHLFYVITVYVNITQYMPLQEKKYINETYCVLHYFNIPRVVRVLRAQASIHRRLSWYWTCKGAIPLTNTHVLELKKAAEAVLCDSSHNSEAARFVGRIFWRPRGQNCHVPQGFRNRPSL